MDEKLFDELKSNLKEAVQISKGRASPKTMYVVFTPAQIKALRRIGDREGVSRDVSEIVVKALGWARLVLGLCQVRCTQIVLYKVFLDSLYTNCFVISRLYTK